MTPTRTMFQIDDQKKRAENAGKVREFGYGNQSS
jgi:hypothetical protein